ncbi:MAG: NAD(P)H:quinone oxidoreductase, type IV, partial [Gemmatimonadota bacterium]|nr:NAD(P)H:quinone oxidoreductase, type IV [Gemmatimonadota bacterium]
MSQVKLSIIYYSTYGTNHQMAETAAEAAKAAGAEVRLRRVRETAPEA